MVQKSGRGGFSFCGENVTKKKRGLKIGKIYGRNLWMAPNNSYLYRVDSMKFPQVLSILHIMVNVLIWQPMSAQNRGPVRRMEEHDNVSPFWGRSPGVDVGLSHPMMFKRKLR